MILKERRSVNAIGPRAFAKTKLRKINIPGDYSIIYDQAFADTPLEEIVFNEGVKYIGSRVIKNTNVKEVRVPESVLAIEADAFKDSSIEKLYLPKKFQEKNGVTIYPKCCKSLSLPWDCEVIYY